ncbi:MAG: hypothetical protein F6K41_41690 [Symploca sp. SIO3E6]|nr:hypothetical protein [Caldora sp. SIO3E6]
MGARRCAPTEIQSDGENEKPDFSVAIAKDMEINLLLITCYLLLNLDDPAID